jgi:hypothetical protein
MINVNISNYQPHEMLLKLASPLAGYLGRIKGELCDHDRVYFLHKL